MNEENEAIILKAIVDSYTIVSEKDYENLQHHIGDFLNEIKPHPIDVAASAFYWLIQSALKTNDPVFLIKRWLVSLESIIEAIRAVEKEEKKESDG